MRRLVVGILLLVWLLLSPGAMLRGETRGEVEAIGFGSLYRPNCFTPMLVRVQADESGTYQIRIVQDDLDADQPLFTQTVSLTGADGVGAGSAGSQGGQGGEQRFWLYFIPQPTDGGLPDPPDGLRALQQSLKVFLCDERGRQLVQLPVTSTILNVERSPQSSYGYPRGVKLVLAVAGGGAQPVWRDYQQAIGTLEDVVFVPVRVADLPEDVRGYEAVDAIVWLNAPPPDADKAADEKRYHALREYVRGGGHLVVCQPPQRSATMAFDDLLPVEVKEIAPRDDLQPLRRLASPPQPRQRTGTNSGAGAGVRAGAGELDTVEEEGGRGPAGVVDNWGLLTPPFMFARATPKSAAVVEEKLIWNEAAGDTSPYLARIGFGAGCVSWVAHDLSDPSITARAKSGWPYVWDRVLDYRHDLLIVDNRTTESAKARYGSAPTRDVGFALLEGMQLTAKVRMLVTIAVVFFIAYWVIAGPGIYVYLLSRSRSQLSWFLFALSAVAATALTVLVVRLVVRGAPEMSHVTVVRTSPDAPSLALSRFGLYIPRDGAQEIVLPQVEPRTVSYLTAYPVHPAHAAGSIEYPAHKQYIVPTRDPAAEEPVKLSVPYRSTLKQFQARRVGTIPGGGIEGKPRLRQTESLSVLEGTLLNPTGHRLKNVYFVFHTTTPREEDQVYFLPAWEKSQSIDLAAEFATNHRFIRQPGDSRQANNAQPEDGFKIRDTLGRAGQYVGWSNYWYASMRNTGMGNSTVSDLDQPVSKSFPMLSLFGRLPPMANSVIAGRLQNDRSELLRRGARDLDISAAVAAGQLVVLAEADGQSPLPFELEVEGDQIRGSGRLFYQSILPLERIELLPSTQPGTVSASTSAAPTADVSGADSPPDESVPPAMNDNGFDPATYSGPLNTLAPEQRRAVLQARREESRRQMQERQKRPAPPPAAVPTERF